LARERDLLAELYSVPPEDFVSERTRLARSLRDDGRDAEARELAALRKPPLPAYLANLLAHERPRDVAALVKAAEAVAAAHGKANADRLREAQRTLGDKVRELVAAAPEVAGRAVSDAVEQRLAETLRAAATDARTAKLLRRGVLQDEVETSGFEALAGMALPSRSATQKKGAARSTPESRRDSAERQRAERLSDELAEARRELRSAETALAAAERDATRARKRVSDLEARLERLS
jgi:hypothetical protein